jgi:hypothetical protein
MAQVVSDEYFENEGAPHGVTQQQIKVYFR